jgi:hypothetical protein
MREPKKTLATEDQRTSSTQGSIRVQIQQMQQQNTTTANQIMNDAAQVYSANMSALTGLNTPPNISTCIGGAPQVQLGCVQNMQQQMSSMLHGNNSANYTISGQIKGSNPNNYIPVSCQGINGCVTAMQNIQRNIKVDQTRIDTSLKNYVLVSNQQTEAFAKGIAAQLSPQNCCGNQSAEADGY